MKPEAFETQAKVTRTFHWLQYVMPFCAFAPSLFDGTPSWVWMITTPTMLVGIIAMFVMRRVRDTTVGSDGEAIIVHGNQGILRRRFRSALILDDPKGARVRFEGTFENLDALVPDRHEAQKLVRAAGLAPDHENIRVQAGYGKSPGWAVALPLVLGIVGGWLLSNVAGFHGLAPFSFPLILGLIMMLAASAFVQVSWEIGQDGVVVRQYGRGTFIPFREVLEIRNSGNGADYLTRLEMVLESGRCVEARFGAAGHAERNAVADRLHQVYALYKEKAKPHTAVFARTEMDKNAWRANLQKRVAEQPGYRANAIPINELWDTLESPGADPTARAAAAFTLRKSGTEAKQRIRVTASTTAQPQLRVAFEKAADDDDEAALEAAASVEAARTM